VKEYVAKAQELVAHCDTKGLEQLVQKYEKRYEGSAKYRALFRGERAFYRHRYAEALWHTLKARGIPLFHFFCFRAAAHLCFEEGEREKAVRFAKRALLQIPDDKSCRELLDEISSSKETFPSVSVSEEELGELNELFKL